MRHRAVAFADQTLVLHRAQALLKRRPGTGIDPATGRQDMTLQLPGHQVA